MQEQPKLTITEKKARRYLYASLSAFALFALAFLVLPSTLQSVSAATRIDAEVDWGSVSMTFDPDMDATTAGDSAPGDAGHGDVDFGLLTPTTTSASNRGTMKVLKRTIGVETTGKYYTVYLSSIDNDTNLNLSTTVDGQPVNHTSINIPAIGDGETEGTFSSPSHFGADSGWGYAVPGASSTGIPDASSAFVVPQLVNQQINGATETAGASQTYNDTYWSGVAPRSNPQQIWKSETSDVEGFSNGDSFDMYYGIQVTDNTLAGSYSHQIVYTALASAAALDRVSSNIAHNREAGGRGDLVQLTVDLNDSLQTITSSMFRVALVPHSVMAQHIDGQNNYSVSDLTFSDYKSCPIASFQHGANNEYVNLSCVLPDAEEGEQFDFWVKINGYNIDYVSKDFSGNNLIASFIYAGLQTKYPSSDARSGTFAVQEMQEMTEGVCSLTNAWGTGTGTDARVYNHTGTGETLGVAQTDTDMLMNIGTFALTDNRDNKGYLVRRLADGNCWMVSNLDLDLQEAAEGVISLTSKNTDLNTMDSWTPNLSTITSFPASNATDARTGNVDLMYIDNTDIFTDSMWNVEHATQYTGDYYNWYAANAETTTGLPLSNSQDSICPLGWQIPNNDNIGDPNLAKSYTQLLKNRTTGYGIYTTDGDTVGLQVVNEVYKTPLSMYAFGSFSDVTGRLAGNINRTLEFVSGYTRGDNVSMTNRLYADADSTTNMTVWSYGRVEKYKLYTARCVSRDTTLPDDYEPEEATPACGPGKICYDGNLATSGEMDDQTAVSNTSVMLTAPLYKKTGYAFAGWNTEENGFGTTYGPNQILTTPDLSSEGLQLYAKWVPSVGTFQTWTGCSAMDTDQVIGLTDSRDGKTYSVAKLKDGNCWMTQNLNLDLTAFTDPNGDVVLDSTNTDLNSKSTWVPDASTLTSTLTNATTARYRYNSDYQESYYNWYAATAESGTETTTFGDGPATDSICPVGWQLADYSGSKSSENLLSSYSIATQETADVPYDDARFAALTSFPLSWVFKYQFYRPDETVSDAERSTTWLTTASNVEPLNAQYSSAYRAPNNNGEVRRATTTRKTYALTSRCVQR